MPQLTDEQKVAIARDGGILRPWTVMNLSREIGVPFYGACAYLEQETGGGHNVFGSDRGKPGLIRGEELLAVTGNRTVTRDRYLIYKMQRPDLGMQGVGPLQLTWWEVQDEADALGGCWKPTANTEVGLKLIAEFKAEGRTWHETAVRWNGGEAFGDHNDMLRNDWRERLAA